MARLEGFRNQAEEIGRQTQEHCLASTAAFDPKSEDGEADFFNDLDTSAEAIGR